MKNPATYVRGLAAGLALLAAVNANGAHELMYAVSPADGNLFSFYSDAPSSILTSFAISGLQPTEVLRGIDYVNGTLYGVGSLSRLYTIDLGTHAATQVGSQFSVFLNGASFGVDASTTTMRVVSNLRQNLSIDLATGVATALPDVNPGIPNITALAFRPGANAPTNWIAGDSLANTFGTFVPSTGVFSSLGAAGIDFARANGFDISSATGIAYLASPAASSDPSANLYIVNLATGGVILVGLIGNPGDNYLVNGLTVITSSPLTPATLSSPVITNSDQFQFTLSGQAGGKYAIQFSTDLARTNWLPIYTNTAPFNFLETVSPTVSSQRFYRGQALP